MKCVLDGIVEEMFTDYDWKDDIAMLENLLAQIVDLKDLEMATAYDPTTKTDWCAEDVIVYLDTKYKGFIFGGEIKGPEEW